MTMRWLVLSMLVAGLVLATACEASARTYYVRGDGGTAAKCNGASNASASAAPNCAWSSLMEALPPTASNAVNPARIKGGDTVIVEPGSYVIGWTPTASKEWGSAICSGLYAPGCVMQPVPSGTASQPTRILGAGWDTGCAAPPELWGTQGAHQVISLDGASNVVIACLDLTDHSNCIVNYGPDPSMACDKHGSAVHPIYGPWADTGIHAQDSHNVTLQDLDIHGLADMGVQAGRISNWTVTRVKVRGNGSVGWNGDLGGNDHVSTNSGTLTFTDLTVIWNGCAEQYPVNGTYINCWGQNEGGYGDGFGEAWTGGHFVFIRPVVEYNTQDGLDLLYANGSGSVTVDSGYFARNAGNDIKTSGRVTVTNSVFVGQCAWWRTTRYPAAADSCRAGGGELADFTAPNQTVTYAYNTITGESGCLFGGNNTYHGTSTPVVSSDVYQVFNNIFLGQPSAYNRGQQTCFAYYGEPVYATINYASNIVWNVKHGACPAGSICKDPKLKNQGLQAFDPEPLAGSPAINAARAAFGHKLARPNIGAAQPRHREK